MANGDEFTNPLVAGVMLSFYYEGIRAIGNGIVRLFFATSIDDWVADKMGDVYGSVRGQ